MNVLKRCCFRSLKENRKRTLVTIVGVVLATALITGIASLAVSARMSLIASARMEGDYHYAFFGVSGDDLDIFRWNTNIEKFGLAREVGYAVLEGSQNPDKPYLFIREADQGGLEAMAPLLTEGRMPEKEDELAIGRHILYNGMVNLKVGDELTLQVGERLSDGHTLDQGNPYAYEKETFHTTFTKTYTVVGIVERPDIRVENRYAPGYSAFTRMGEDAAQSLDARGTYEVYATYTPRGLKHADQVTAGILGVPEDLLARYSRTGMCTGEEYAMLTKNASDVQAQSELIRWQLFRFSDRTMNVFYGMAALAVAVVMVTSVFCIRNSFMISLTEKMKLYGRLASVGATSGQQRKMVYYEAAFLGMVGIPLGVASGILASAILVKGISGLLDDAAGIPMVFGISLPAVLTAALLAAATIYFSAMQSARKAAKVTPLEAIRASESVKIGKREMKCPRLVGKVFGIGGKVAYRNLRRNRRKYRTTVVSIAVSVSVFVGLSTFVELMRTAVELDYQDIPYQLVVTFRGEDSYGNALNVTKLAGVEQVEILRILPVETDFDSLEADEDFLKDYQETRGRLGNRTIKIVSLGEKGFEAYCESVGVDEKEARDKAIVYAGYELRRYSEKEGYIVKRGTVARFSPGEVLTVRKQGAQDGSEAEGAAGTVEAEIPVLVQTDQCPMSLTGKGDSTVNLIVSDEKMEKLLDVFAASQGQGKETEVYIQCEDAGMMERDVRQMQTKQYPTHIRNYQQEYREGRSAYLLTMILLYGFIAVVALIGITSIFNTITTNLELRAPEFAMLRAVGMTKREFSRMIWLEGIFYAGKALAFGLPIGFILSLGFYQIFSGGIVTRYRPPVGACLLSAAAVALLLYGIMHYSMGKINRRNIVETIQNENL